MRAARSGFREPLRHLGAALFVTAAAAACGGGDDTGSDSAPARAPATSGGERAEPQGQGDFEVTGTLGTLDAREVEQAVARRTDAFVACFTSRSEAVDVLGGVVTFRFRVGPEGRVTWVALEESTVGDRATERCLLEAARNVRFPRPRGGAEAEVAAPFGVDARDDVRPAVEWAAERARPALAEHAATLLESCHAAPEDGLTVTAYVAPGGRVLAAGATAAEPMLAPEVLDCVTTGVAAWTLPDPGSYPAKVTFPLAP